MYSTVTRHQDCMIVLLAFGAEVDRLSEVWVVDNIIYTAFFLPGRHGWNSYCRLSQPHLCGDQDEVTALMPAAQFGYPECICILLAHGANVDRFGKVRISCAPLCMHWPTALADCVHVDFTEGRLTRFPGGY